MKGEAGVGASIYLKMNTSIAVGKNTSLTIPAGFMECIQEQCGKFHVLVCWREREGA